MGALELVVEPTGRPELEGGGGAGRCLVVDVGGFVDWRLHPERKGVGGQEKKLEDTASILIEVGDILYN
jgi:hypothetical protein